MNHAPGTGSIARHVDQQSSTLTMYLGCPLVIMILLPLTFKLFILHSYPYSGFVNTFLFSNLNNVTISRVNKGICVYKLLTDKTLFSNNDLYFRSCNQSTPHVTGLKNVHVHLTTGLPFKTHK